MKVSEQSDELEAIAVQEKEVAKMASERAKTTVGELEVQHASGCTTPLMAARISMQTKPTGLPAGGRSLKWLVYATTTRSQVQEHVERLRKRLADMRAQLRAKQQALASTRR